MLRRLDEASFSACCQPSSKRQVVGETRSTNWSFSRKSSRPIAGGSRNLLAVGRARDIPHVNRLIWRGDRGQATVDGRQSLLGNLTIELAQNVQLRARSKLLGSQFLGAQAQGLGQIRPIDPQLAILPGSSK